ncbi:MAG: hypothetical protein ACKOC5_10710, partial [Chloroflexota bacterium]
MNANGLTLRKAFQALIAGLAMLVSFWPAGSAGAFARAQGQVTTLTLSAPAAVALGERIEVQLVVDHAR